ncbi:MAG: YfhO family protein, partial [Clostridiaceae bacterium]|nr:YfhO family protein [Clostridiaceae bacterium]
GLLSLVLIPLFAGAKSISRRYKWASFGFLGILFLVFHVSYLNFLFNGLDLVTWFPFRYAFVFTFLLLRMGAEGFGDASFRYMKDKKIFLYCVSGFAFLFLLPSVPWEYRADQATAIFIFAINVVFFFIFSVLLEMKKIKPVGLLLLLVIELFINSTNIQRNLDRFAEYADYDGWVNRQNQIETIVSENRSQEEPGRIALRTETLTGNDPALFGMEGIDFYSSLANSKVAGMLQNMGYFHYMAENYDVTDNGGTLLSDALLGMEGLVMNESPIRTMTTPPSVFPMRHQGDRSVWNDLVYQKPPIYLSRAFGVNESVVFFQPDLYEYNPMRYGDALLESITNTPVSTYESVHYEWKTENAHEWALEEYGYAYRQINSGTPGRITLQFDGRGEGSMIYINFETLYLHVKDDENMFLLMIEQNGTRRVIKETDFFFTFSHLNIGDYPENEPVLVTFEFAGLTLVIDRLSVYSQSVDDVRMSVEPLLANRAEFEWTGSASARIQTESDTGE